MRITTLVLVFLVFLNGSAGVFVQSGAAADWGVAPNPGGDQAIEEANSTSQDLQSSGGFGDTLFGLFVSVANWFSNLIGAIFAAPSMFVNLGMPAYLATFIFGPLYILATADIAYILTGRRL